MSTNIMQRVTAITDISDNKLLSLPYSVFTFPSFLSLIDQYESNALLYYILHFQLTDRLLYVRPSNPPCLLVH